MVTSDLCHIIPDPSSSGDAEIFCIRAILEIPIEGASDPFTWGIWVTQSEDNFVRYAETFDEDQSELQSFGWLPVVMPYYNVVDAGAPLEHLECEVVWQGKGQRPTVHLWESAHQLSIDQHEGISWQKAVEIANLANKGTEASAGHH